MQELAKLSLTCTLLFVGALIVAYALGSVVRWFRRVPSPLPNGQLRIRSGASVYRARFMGETPEGWTFSVPLQRDSYVPLRVGEDLIVEAPSHKGLLRFRTKVVGRRQDPPMMVAARPREIHVDDRRSEPRRRDLGNDPISFDGNPGLIADICSTGAKVIVDHEVSQGERVRIDLPWKEEPDFGWTLESERVAGRFEVRLRFEEPIDLPPLK